MVHDPNVMRTKIKEYRYDIEFPSLNADDALRLLKRYVRAAPFTGLRKRGVTLNFGAGYADKTPLIILLSSATIYLGRKIVDILAEETREWLKKKRRCHHRRIDLFGPNGEVIKIVECKLKPGQHE
jgi:hypothetical protein